MTNVNVVDHAETSSRRLNWYVNKADLFEMFLQRLAGTEIKPTNLRRRSNDQIVHKWDWTT